MVPLSLSSGYVSMVTDNMQESPRSSLDSFESGLHGQLLDIDFDSIADWDFVETDQSLYSNIQQNGNNMQSRYGNMMGSHIVGKLTSGCGAFMQNISASESMQGTDSNVCSSVMSSFFGQPDNSNQQDRNSNYGYASYGNQYNFGFNREI